MHMGLPSSWFLLSIRTDILIEKSVLVVFGLGFFFYYFYNRDVINCISDILAISIPICYFAIPQNTEMLELDYQDTLSEGK